MFAPIEKDLHFQMQLQRVSNVQQILAIQFKLSRVFKFLHFVLFHSILSVCLSLSMYLCYAQTDEEDIPTTNPSLTQTCLHYLSHIVSI